MDLVVRDYTTGESRTFTPTSDGYREAEAYRQSILERHHRISDDDTNSLGRLDDFFSGNGNLGRPKNANLHWW